MVEIQLCINLRSGKIAVSQQFLHSTDIARCLQKMGCIAVAHHVRRDMAGTAHAHCPRLQAFLDLTPVRARPEPAGRHRLPVPLHRRQGGALVARDRAPGAGLRAGDGADGIGEAAAERDIAAIRALLLTPWG